MNLTKTVYESLQEKHSYPVSVTLEDIVRNDCSYQNYLRFIGETPIGPEKGSQIMVREIGKGIKKMSQKYLSECFGNKFEVIPKGSLYDAIDVHFTGCLGSTLVEVILSPSGGFDSTVSSGKLPGWVTALVATKVHLLKKKSALVLMFNRNNQTWCSFGMRGDFSSLAKEVLSEAKEFSVMLSGGTEHVGVERACRRCQYRKICGASKRPPKQPYTTSFVDTFVSADLCTRLDKYLWEMNSRKNTRATHCIHPSEFSTFTCDRRIAYGLMGVAKKESISAQLRRIFDVGHLCHDVIQGTLKSVLGDRCSLEVPIDHPAMKMKGHCDGVIDGDAGIEIKSISYKGFDKLGGAKKEHQKQGTLYGFPLSLSNMTYLYVNKDSGEMQEYPMPIAKSLWHNLAARAESIIKEVERGALPTRITKDYLCKGCPYVWKCRPELRR